MRAKKTYIKSDELAETSISWWAYVHRDGSIKLKRYLSQSQLSQAEGSPFVILMIMPFFAKNNEAAMAMINEHLIKMANKTKPQP